MYHQLSAIQRDAKKKDVEIEADKKIVVGKFVDRERFSYIDSMNRRYQNKLGEKYKPLDANNPLNKG